MFFQSAAGAATAAFFSVEKEISALFYSDSSSASSHYGSSYSLWVWSTMLLFGLYTFVSLLCNAVACYNFIVAWNLIARQHRVDLERLHFSMNDFISRRIQVQEALETKLYSEILCSGESLDLSISCPICLNDFDASDRVSSFRQKCRHLFHNDCLSAWLEKEGSCPCCRLDVLPRAPHRLFH